MWPNPQFPGFPDLVTFTEEILNGKLNFCAVKLSNYRIVKNKFQYLVGKSQINFMRLTNEEFIRMLLYEIVILFMKYTEVYLEPNRTSTKELSTKIVNSWKALIKVNIKISVSQMFGWILKAPLI